MASTEQNIIGTLDMSQLDDAGYGTVLAVIMMGAARMDSDGAIVCVPVDIVDDPPEYMKAVLKKKFCNDCHQQAYTASDELAPSYICMRCAQKRTDAGELSTVKPTSRAMMRDVEAIAEKHGIRRQEQ